MIDLFQFDSYKAYLKRVLLDHSSERGFQAKMARAAGCQPSYLTQTLRSEVELTPDHGAKLAKFLSMNGPETDYF